MSRITYRVKNADLDLSAMSKADLYEVLFNVIRKQHKVWQTVLDGKFVMPKEAIQRGPIYFAEITTIWNMAMDILEDSEDIDAMYDGLEHFSMHYTGGEKPEQLELYADDFDLKMLALKREI